jgi:hypothetical protein
MMTWTWILSSVSAGRSRGPQRRRRYVATGAALLCLSAVAVHATPQENDAALPKVTIEAAKQRQALRQQVDRFVLAAVKQPMAHQSLMRWNSPVCPLVLGLARTQGEYILARISQIARDARVPLGGKSCQPNFYVVVTAKPNAVLKEWWAKDPRVDTHAGIEPLRRFLDSTQPVRVWYDAMSGCSGAPPNPSSAAAAELSSVAAGSVGISGGAHAGASSVTGGLGTVYCDNSVDTHLTFGDIRSISSVLIVADSNKLKQVKLGPLADYASLVGLIEIRPESDGGGAPTILRLFSDPKPPDTLTPWDRALLYSLYNTAQSSSLQLVDMEQAIVKRVAP